MKAILLFLTFITLIFGAQKEKIYFGINPWNAPETLQKNYAPLIKYLSNALGKEVELVVSKDYNSLSELLAKGVVDIASLSPNLYIQTKKLLPNLKYIATTNTLNGSGEIIDGYRGIIVTLKSSKIKKLEDLKNRTFGFTDIASTSGFLIPTYTLKQHGITSEDFKNYYMLKKHDRVINAIAKGSIDAGATYDEMLVSGKKEHGDIFRILNSSELIPYDAVVINSNVDSKLAEAIKKAILSYKAENPEYRGGPVRFTPLGDEAYNYVRELDRLNSQN